MICIYHNRDLDGYTSGAIVKTKYPDAILVGYDYGQTLNIGFLPLDQEDVIMIDVSMEPQEMFDLAKKCKSFTWIDHHASAIDKYEKVKHEAPDNFKAVLQDGIAACEVGWKYLFPNLDMPKAVLLLGEYDTWRKGDQQRWDNQIMPFQYGMRLRCNSPETFPGLLLDDPDFTTSGRMIDNIIDTGKTIIEYEEKMNESACKRAFEFEFEGLRAICLNGGGFSSNVFKSVYNEEKHDIMMPFQYDGKQWIFSMYTTKDIDLSVIAKKWGGGGHKKACGFQVNDLGLVFTFLNSKNATELVIKQLPDNRITFEMEGNEGDLAVMLCRAMMASVDLASIVCGALPTYLDNSGIDREGYCKAVMAAKGGRK